MMLKMRGASCTQVLLCSCISVNLKRGFVNGIESLQETSQRNKENLTISQKHESGG